MTKQVWDEIQMISPHLFYQILPSLFELDDCTQPKCGELSKYTDSAHTEVGARCNSMVMFSTQFILRLYGIKHMVKYHGGPTEVFLIPASASRLV